MSPSRRLESDETWHRLRVWSKDQKTSERLAAALLQSEGYTVDPSHPLGGPDGGKDALCSRDGRTMICAVYFPREPQAIGDIKRKLRADSVHIAKHRAQGLIFVTNQQLSVGERRELEELVPGHLEIYHLERLTLLLNQPRNYGFRYEFLGIDITQEEWLAFQAARDEQHYRRFEALEASVRNLLAKIEAQAHDLVGYSTGGDSFAYFRPEHHVKTTLITFVLVHEGKYPVHGVHGRYVDLAEARRTPDARLGHAFSFPYLAPGSAIPDALVFDVANVQNLDLNMFFNTRSRSIMELVRITRVSDRFFYAVQIKVDGVIWRQDIQTDYPGYDPADPEAIFRKTSDR